ARRLRRRDVIVVQDGAPRSAFAPKPHRLGRQCRPLQRPIRLAHGRPPQARGEAWPQVPSSPCRQRRKIARYLRRWNFTSTLHACATRADDYLSPPGPPGPPPPCVMHPKTMSIFPLDDALSVSQMLVHIVILVGFVRLS